MITLATCCNKCWDPINALSLVVRFTIFLDVPFTGGHWTLSDIRQAATFKHGIHQWLQNHMISFCMPWHPLGVSWQHDTELLGVDRRFIRFPNVSAYQEHHPKEYQKHLVKNRNT